MYYNFIGPFNANCRSDITFSDDKSTKTDCNKIKTQIIIAIMFSF